MARIYQITEEEMLSLIDQLELAKLRSEREHRPEHSINKADIDMLHRIFHYHVVSWAQNMGFDGYRK